MIASIKAFFGSFVTIAAAFNKAADFMQPIMNRVDRWLALRERDQKIEESKVKLMAEAQKAKKEGDTSEIESIIREFD